jgi:hypothetical protein
VGQMYEPSCNRGVLAESREESDSGLLGIREETPAEVVEKALDGLK